MRILVVDDDLIQQQVLAYFLSQHGFYVETAANGMEAIRKSREESFHVVLIDYSMPDVDGQSVARVIGRGRGDNRYPWLIAVSGNLRPIVQDEELTGRAFDHLVQKPWNPDQLLGLIKNCDRPPSARAEREPETTHENNANFMISESTIIARYTKQDDRPQAMSGSAMKVLLVDPDPALLADFTVSLGERGYQVDAVSSTEEALQRISAVRYDIVLADYLKLSRFCGPPAAYASAKGAAPIQAGVVDVRPAPIADVSPPADYGELEQAPMHVLVADDNGLNLDVIGSILHAAGHRFSAVDNGEAAVAAARAGDVDVILMDVRMPEVDGLEATRRIRAGSGPWACVPIIGLTAQAPQDQLAHLAAAGMDGYLLRPFEQDSLTTVVMRAGQIKRRECRVFDDLAAVPVESIGIPPPPSQPIIGDDLPTLDREIFDRVKSYLGEEKTGKYVQSQASNAWSLLRKLEAQTLDTALAKAVVDEVHKVGGGAGTFGFVRLLQVCQGFELAAGTTTADIPEHAQGLIAALQVTLEMIGDLQ